MKQQQRRRIKRPIYSTNQEDGKPSEDAWLNEIREDLGKYKTEGQEEKDIISRFKDPDGDIKFLIVCNKLLTGFDARWRTPCTWTAL